MYINDLLKAFEKALANYAELSTDAALKDEFRRSIEGRKYDLQDEALIEAILRDDESELTDSFTSAFNNLLDKLEATSRDEFLKSKGARKEAIRIYFASLENLITLYYNGLIGRHFSAA